MKIKTLMHQECVPDDRACTLCGRTKKEVQFSVRKLENRKPQINKLCQHCNSQKRKNAKLPKKIKKIVAKMKIKERIDLYFRIKK
jgi:hypothetical protein